MFFSHRSLRTVGLLALLVALLPETLKLTTLPSMQMIYTEVTRLPDFVYFGPARVHVTTSLVLLAWQTSVSRQGLACDVPSNTLMHTSLPVSKSLSLLTIPTIL